MASSKINIDLVLNTKGFRPLGRINGQLGEFEKSLDASNARVLAFGASAGAILAVRKAFTATVKAAIEVEKSLQDINVILQATSANLKKFGSDLFQIASQTGQSFQVAAQAAAELARQGLGTEETLKRTRDALILARLSGMGAAEAVNSLTAAINTFNKAGLDSTVIINKLANVDAAFAVSSDDLAKALGRVGSSAQGAGVSLDQLLAIVTTVQQKTARGGAVIGNSFKTIFTRIQRPRVIQELENLGIAVRDVEGDVLPAIKVLNNLAKQFDHLSQSQRSQISELVGGVFQVNILKAAMSDLSKETGIYNRALDISLGSSDQALRRNEELNKTLSAQFNKTVNTFKEGAAELGQLTFAPALENLFGIVEGFEKLGDTQGGKIGGAIAKSIFEGIGQFMSGPGLLIIGYTLFKTFSQLGKFAADAFKTLTGLNKNFQTQLNLQKQIFNVLDENPDLLRRIKDGTLSVEEAHEEIYKQISKNTSALEEQLRMSQRLAQGLQGGGVGFSPDFGAFTGPRKPKFGAASGYTPNFADEVAGMMASGYSRSQIKNPKVRKQNIHDGMGGSFTSTVNGHEDIINTRNSMGKKATFVVPPRNTDAYKNYMSSLSSGFIPNFTIEANPITQDDINALRALKDTPKVNGSFPPGVNEGSIAIAKKLNLGKSYLNMGPKAIHDQALKKYNQQQGPTTGYGTPVDLSAKGKKGVKVYDAKGTVGLLGLYGKTSTSGYVEAPINKITEYSDWMSKLPKKAKPNLPGSKIGFKNVEFRSLTKELEDNKQKGEFSKLVRSNLAGGMEQLAQDFSTSILGNDAIKPASIKTSGGALFSTSAEGNIFETAVNALTASSPGRNRAQAFEAALAADEQQVWDFEERGNASSRFKNAFSFNDGLIKADAKRTLSRGAGESMVNKIFNPDGGLTEGSWVDDLNKAKASVKTAANGFIPNFSALFESIRREKEAGVPAGRIRVGQSDRLKSGANPAGIGVYNTRDEPMGLNQGINNSVAAGMDPKKQGRAGGFIPNFQFMKPGAGGKGVPNLPISVPLMLPEKVKRELVNTFTRPLEDADRRGRKGLDGPGSGGMKEADAHVIDAGDGSPSGASADKIVEATEENTATMKSIDRTNRDTSMKTVGWLMLVQQASTGLQNTLGETNNGLKDVVSEMGDLITTIVSLSFANDQLQQRMTERAERIRGANPNASSGDSALDKKVTAGTATEREMNLHDAMLSGKEKLEGARERAKELRDKGQKFSDRMTKKPPKIGRFAKTRGFARRSAGWVARTGASAAGGAGVGAAKIAGAAGKFVAGGGLMAAGAAVAGLKLVGDLGKKWSNSNQELEAATKALARQKEETEKNIGHLNKFGAAAQQAADVFENQNASMAELSKATKEMDKAMLALPAEMRAKLGGIIDPKRVNSMIESMVSKEQDRLAQVQKRADSASLMEEAREKTGFFDVLSGDMTWLGFGKGDEQQKVDNQQVNDLGKSIITGMVSKDSKALEGVDVEKIAKMMHATTDVDERVAQAKKLGLEGQDLATFENFVKQGGNVGEKFVRGITDAAVEIQAELELQKKLKPIREAILKQNKAQQRAVENLKKTLESEQRVRKAVNKIYENGAKSFLTEVGKISLDEISKLSNLQADTNKEFGNVVSQSTNALGTAMEGGGLQGTGIDAQVQSLIKNATTQGVGSVGETEVENLQGLLDKQIEKLGDDEDNLLAEQQIKELQGLKIELDNLRGNSERLNKELVDQTNEIQEQTKAQKAVARQQQRLRSFGGTQALLDPSKLNTSLGQIQAGAQAMNLSAAAGSTTGFNRGRINQLSAMQDLFGGSLPERMREEGLKRAESVKFADMQKMNKALGMGMSDAEMRKAAQEQAAALFKGDNPTDRNTAAIESLTKAITGNEEMVDRSLKDVTAVNEAQNVTNKDKAQRAEDFRSVAKRLKLASDRRVSSIQTDTANLADMTTGGTDDIASMMLRGEAGELHKVMLGQLTRAGIIDPNSALGKEANMSDMKFLGMQIPGQMSAEERIKFSGMEGPVKENKMAQEMEADALKEGQKIINNKTDIKFIANRDGGVDMTTSGDVDETVIDAGIDSLREFRAELARHRKVIESSPEGRAALGRTAPVSTLSKDGYLK